MAAPLTDLTKKGQPEKLRWEEAQNRAFETLKAHISCPPVLRLPDFSREFVLQTDACNDGIGGILLQEEDGIKHPKRTKKLDESVFALLGLIMCFLFQCIIIIQS